MQSRSGDPEVAKPVLITACRQRQLRIVFAVSVLWMAARVVQPQAMNVTQWHSGLVTLNQGWLQQGGDDLTRAQPSFDDRGWEKIELDDAGAATPGWTWYRIHLKLAPDHD